jgi:hypothetical protein
VDWIILAQNGRECCDEGNEHLGIAKCGKNLDWLRKSSFVQRNSAPWSWSFNNSLRGQHLGVSTSGFGGCEALLLAPVVNITDHVKIAIQQTKRFLVVSNSELHFETVLTPC